MSDDEKKQNEGWKHFFLGTWIGRIVLGILLIALVAIPALEEYGYHLNLTADSEGTSRVEIKPREKEQIQQGSSEAPNQSDSSSPVLLGNQGGWSEDFGCYDDYAFPIFYPETWYGPINGYSIMYHQYGGFEVFSPDYNITSFPDPGATMTRNSWIWLNGTPFDVCVDSNGSVFAWFDY